jgi:hypothetical protein
MKPTSGEERVSVNSTGSGERPMSRREALKATGLVWAPPVWQVQRSPLREEASGRLGFTLKHQRRRGCELTLG